MKVDWDKIMAWAFIVFGWVFVGIFLWWTIR